MKRLVLVTAAVLAVLAIACGGGGSKDGDSGLSDDAAIRQSMAQFTKAFNDGKAKDMIALMDSESRKTCQEKDLAVLVGLVKAFGGNKKFDLQVKSVDVKGDKATAVVIPTIAGEKQDEDKNNLTKENGKWRISMSKEDCGSNF